MKRRNTFHAVPDRYRGEFFSVGKNNSWMLGCWYVGCWVEGSIPKEFLSIVHIQIWNMQIVVVSMNS
jgi:hypothetical protein